MFDKELSDYLLSKNHTCNIYGTQAVMKFSSIAVPFSEMSKLWDFFTCFGFHWNIVALVAMISIERDSILSASKPNDFLNNYKWFPINADKVLTVMKLVLKKLPVCILVCNFLIL